MSEAEFIAIRLERDKDLAALRRLLSSVQLNIRAGRLPLAEAKGARYLKIPMRLPAELT